ncbi:MAG: alpha/beta hydrolase [Hyphomicrobiales bacterium]|nr:alpha/beta hydrolase [Hyphomicrobiales bacterium]MCC2109535.1 alpha/beta hydrolase [Hyphomicrobiales bacterium]
MTDLTIRAGDIRLAVSVYGSSEQPPVALLHGVSNSRDTWEEIAASLSTEYQVWTMDFRGHGHSDRAASYDISGYVADARALIETIGRQTIVVGHSLGGCVAGVLAQEPHHLVRGALLEDPPWYLGDPVEWSKSAVSQLFPIVAARQAEFQASNAALSAYVEFLSNAPSPLGGRACDHIGQRHLLSRASGLQRQDNLCWGAAARGGQESNALSAIDTTRAFQRPTRILRGDPHLGGVILEGHDIRLARTNPDARIIQYTGCGHLLHQTAAFEDRFLGDVRDFLSSFPSC